jgi:hypothetical protein
LISRIFFWEVLLINRDFIAAIGDGDIVTVEEFISRGEDINQSEGSPLFVAIENGRFSIAKLLVTNGANTLLQDEYGDNALNFAIRQGKYNIADFLIKSGHPTADIIESWKNRTRERLLLKYDESYVPIEVERFTFDFIKTEDMQGLIMVARKKLIESEKIDDFIEYSINENKTQITAFLLHYKKDEVGFNLNSIEL